MEYYRNNVRSRPQGEEMIEPGPGQESVWDYPRPPRVEQANKPVRVEIEGIVIAQSDRAVRVLETASPPAYYIPREDVRMEFLETTERRTFCEWKGQASYFAVVVGDRREPNAAWTYPNPTRGYEDIKDHIAFYPERVDACYVGDEQVQPQPGAFYGGWVTSNIVGPFKGAPGTQGW